MPWLQFSEKSLSIVCLECVTFYFYFSLIKQYENHKGRECVGNNHESCTFVPNTELAAAASPLRRNSHAQTNPHRSHIEEALQTNWFLRQILVTMLGSLLLTCSKHEGRGWAARGICAGATGALPLLPWAPWELLGLFCKSLLLALAFAAGAVPEQPWSRMGCCVFS